jgi:hypothetical protein
MILFNDIIQVFALPPLSLLWLSPIQCSYACLVCSARRSPPIMNDTICSKWLLYNKKSPLSLKLWRAEVGPAGLPPSQTFVCYGGQASRPRTYKTKKPHAAAFCFVGPAGLEPATTWLWVLNREFHPFTHICMYLYQFNLKLIKCKILHGVTLICKNTGETTGTVQNNLQRTKLRQIPVRKQEGIACPTIAMSCALPCRSSAKRLPAKG